jgi:transcriptional regulator with XRE-family HTH domain
MGRTLGDRLRRLRRERNETQEAVAAAIGIRRASYTNIERGRDQPGRETLLALARHFRRPPESLIGDGNDQDPHLTERERRLLEAFRRLTEEDQQALIRFAEGRAGQDQKS